MRLFELFDSQEVDFHMGATRFTAEASFTDGSWLELVADKIDGVWHVNFEVDGAFEQTGAGIEFEVFGAVVKAMKIMVEHYKPNMMFFSSKGASRTSLYRKLSRRLGDLNVVTFDLHGSTEFFLYRDMPDIRRSEVGYEKSKGYSFSILDVRPNIYVKNSNEFKFDDNLVMLLTSGNADLLAFLKKIISPILPDKADFIPSDEKTRMTFSYLY